MFSYRLKEVFENIQYRLMGMEGPNMTDKMDSFNYSAWKLQKFAEALGTKIKGQGIFGIIPQSETHEDGTKTSFKRRDGLYIGDRLYEVELESTPKFIKLTIEDIVNIADENDPRDFVLRVIFTVTKCSVAVQLHRESTGSIYNIKGSYTFKSESSSDEVFSFKGDELRCIIMIYEELESFNELANNLTENLNNPFQLIEALI